MAMLKRILEEMLEDPSLFFAVVLLVVVLPVILWTLITSGPDLMAELETEEVTETHELVALGTGTVGEVRGVLTYVRGGTGASYQCMVKEAEGTYRLREYGIDKVTLHTTDDGRYRVEVVKEVRKKSREEERLVSVDLYIPPDGIDMSYSAN